MKSVTWALTVLFVAIAFVYVVFFGVHGKDFGQDPTFQQVTQQWAITGNDNPLWLSTITVQEQQKEDNNEPSQPTNDQPANELPQSEGGDETSIDGQTTGQEQPAQSDDEKPVTAYSVQELFDEQNVEQPDYLALSGTHRWSGEVKSLQMLGLQDDAEYILKDNLNTHYVYLGEFDQRLQSRVVSLSGNVVEIGDKTAIKQHALLGDEVWFINLPAFDQIKVLMIVFFEEQNDAWFLQIDHGTYYDIKDDLQESFGMFYSRGE